jgi:hypothetical protein
VDPARMTPIPSRMHRLAALRTSAGNPAYWVVVTKRTSSSVQFVFSTFRFRGEKKSLN